MKKTNKSTKAPAPASKAKRSKTKLAPPASVPAEAPIVTPSAAATSSQPEFVRGAPAAVTRIRARLDVGFGNALYVRGQGGSLSWDRGIPMECAQADEWVLELPESAGEITFKLLLNDQLWCTGEDYRVSAGEECEFTPEF